MIERYRFYRLYHGRFVSLTMAPDPAWFWGIVGGVLLVLIVVMLP